MSLALQDGDGYHFGVPEICKLYLQAPAVGDGDADTITAKHVRYRADFLTDLCTARSPLLQHVIGTERTNLGNVDDFVGQKTEQGRCLVAG